MIMGKIIKRIIVELLNMFPGFLPDFTVKKWSNGIYITPIIH